MLTTTPVRTSKNNSVETGNSEEGFGNRGEVFGNQGDGEATDGRNSIPRKIQFIVETGDMSDG